jgi:hypothetical protein
MAASNTRIVSDLRFSLQPADFWALNWLTLLTLKMEAIRSFRTWADLYLNYTASQPTSLHFLFPKIESIRKSYTWITSISSKYWRDRNSKKWRCDNKTRGSRYKHTFIHLPFFPFHTVTRKAKIFPPLLSVILFISSHTHTTRVSGLVCVMMSVDTALATDVRLNHCVGKCTRKFVTTYSL